MLKLRRQPEERSRAVSIERLVAHENGPHFGQHRNTRHIKEPLWKQDEKINRRREDVHYSKKWDLFEEKFMEVSVTKMAT